MWWMRRVLPNGRTAGIMGIDDHMPTIWRYTRSGVVQSRVVPYTDNNCTAKDGNGFDGLV